MDYPHDTPENQAPDKALPKRIVFFLGASVLLFMLLGSGILALVCEIQGIDMQESFAAFGKDSPLEWRNFMRGAVLINHLTSFLLPALLTAWFFYKRQWPQNLQVYHRPPLPALGLGLLFMAAAFPLAQQAFELNRWAVEQLPALKAWTGAEEASEKMILGLLVMQSPWELLFSVLVMALVPAIGEEMVFRGLLQQNLIKWWGKPIPAILLTALIFSLAHFQVERLLAIFILGLVLGCLFYWTQNLWVPIAAHFMNNGVQVVVAYAYQGKLDDLDQMEEADIPVVFTIIAALLAVVLGHRLWKNSKESRQAGE